MRMHEAVSLVRVYLRLQPSGGAYAVHRRSIRICQYPRAMRAMRRFIRASGLYTLRTACGERCEIDRKARGRMAVTDNKIAVSARMGNTAMLVSDACIRIQARSTNLPKEPATDR